MLITHRGLSGPAILQISSYWKPGQPISLDLAPERELTGELRDPKARRDLASAKAAFRAVLPQAFRRSLAGRESAARLEQSRA